VGARDRGDRVRGARRADADPEMNRSEAVGCGRSLDSTT